MVPDLFLKNRMSPEGESPSRVSVRRRATAAEPGLLFHQGYRKSLIGQGQGGGHPGQPAADDQAPFDHRVSALLEGFQESARPRGPDKLD